MRLSRSERSSTFSPSAGRLGRALVANNNSVALLRGERTAVLGSHQSAALFRYSRQGRTFDRIAAPDAAGLDLLGDAIAYFAGADQEYRRGGYKALGMQAAKAVRKEAS